MGEILLCSHFSPLGEILLYSSFSGGKFYYGGKTTLQHRHYIAEISLNVTLNHNHQQQQQQSISLICFHAFLVMKSL